MRMHKDGAPVVRCNELLTIDRRCGEKETPWIVEDSGNGAYR